MKMYKISFIVCLLLACNSNNSRKELPYYGDSDFTPKWFTEDSIPPNFHTIAPFSFRNQYGKIINTKSVNGEIKIVNFFFCSCNGICPTTMRNLMKVNNKFPDIPILSHTVTPIKDSVPVLQDYAEAMGISNSNWHLLTGDKKAIYTMARNSYFADNKPNPNLENDFLHTENILLIDWNNRIRGVYKGSFPVEINNLITDIVVLRKLK